MIDHFLRALQLLWHPVRHRVAIAARFRLAGRGLRAPGKAPPLLQSVGCVGVAQSRGIGIGRLATVALLLFAALPTLVVAQSEPSGGSSENASAETASSEAASSEDIAPGTFFESVDVEIVNLDVWVTDKSGAPVAGLTRDDFEVLRDGTPIEITNFYAVAGGQRTAGQLTGESPPASAQPEPALAIDPPPVAPEHRLWLIVFVDNVNIKPLERNRVLPAVRQFLGQTLGPGDRAMIVSYDRALEVRRPFTDQKSLLFATLDELEDESGLATLQQRFQIDTLKRIDDVDTPSQGVAIGRQYAEDLMNSVEYTIDAMTRLIESLGGLPGRKALLHVSSGIPMLAGEEMFHAVAEKFDNTQPYAEIPRHSMIRRFERLNQTANSHRVVFYTLDAGGFRGMRFGNAEYGGFASPSLRSTLETVVPENLQSSLRLMAEETGGRALLNRNNTFEALDEVRADFRSFYSLGISSAGADTGRYHEVKVRLRQPAKGQKIRHRSGYRSKDTDTRMREELRSALLYAHSENSLGIDVVWGRPEPKGKEDFLVPFQLRIPLRDLVFLPAGDDKHVLRLKLFVGAAGKDGEISDVDTVPLGLTLAGEHLEAAKAESFMHVHKLLLSPGRKKIGVAVLDEIGRRSAVVTTFIDVAF